MTDCYILYETLSQGEGGYIVYTISGEGIHNVGNPIMSLPFRGCFVPPICGDLGMVCGTGFTTIYTGIKGSKA